MAHVAKMAHTVGKFVARTVIVVVSTVVILIALFFLGVMIGPVPPG